MDSKQLFKFLSELKKNNTKEWFDENRKVYEKLKKEMQVFVADLIQEISKWDESVADLEPKDCMFRINRDIRFSKDKSPYKTNFGAIITKGGKKSAHAGYYIHLEPGGEFLAGGSYMPQPDQLKAIRQEIDYNPEAFKKIISHKDFKSNFKQLEGDKLSSVPKGYDAENPMSEFLKHKSFLMMHRLTDKDVYAPDFKKNILKVFKAMKPLNDFLNNSLE